MSAPVRLFIGLLYSNCLLYIVVIGATINNENNTLVDLRNTSNSTTPQQNSTDFTEFIFNATDFLTTKDNDITRVSTTLRVITAEVQVYWRSWLVGLMGFVLLLMIIIVCIVIVVQTEDSQRGRVRPSTIVLKGANLARDSSPCQTPRLLRKTKSNSVDEATQISVTPSSSSKKQLNESDSWEEEDSSTTAKE